MKAKGLTANELMIGDWVYGLYPNKEKYPSPFRISAVEIYPTNKSPRIVTYGGYGFQEEYLAPILITPEILEKNGFKIEKNETYCKRYSFACNLGKVPQTVVAFSFYGEGVSADTLFACWTKPKSCDGENSIHICDLKSVHELQHALRLCGIEKEIVL